MTETPRIEGEKDAFARLPAWAQLLSAVWIFGGALWFYVHFSSVFYQQNQAAIDGAWSALRETLGLGG